MIVIFSNQKTEEFLEDILADADKIKSKLPNFSRVIDGKKVILKIRKIYSFTEDNSQFLLFQVRNYDNTPKYLYFLGKKLVSQSSDFIVMIARDFALEHDFELLQFPLRPEIRRVNLLALAPLRDPDNYQDLIELLNAYKVKLLKKMKKIIG
ncbi:MAG: hypothetical protein ACOC44_15790 [Promethearchaeia archaeon]